MTSMVLYSLHVVLVVRHCCLSWEAIVVSKAVELYPSIIELGATVTLVKMFAAEVDVDVDADGDEEGVVWV